MLTNLFDSIFCCSKKKKEDEKVSKWESESDKLKCCEKDELNKNY